MNIWSMANWFAWLASAVLFTIMAIDFIRVEQERRRGGESGRPPVKTEKG